MIYGNKKKIISGIIFAVIFGIILGCIITTVTVFNMPNSFFWTIFGRYPSDLTDFELQIRLQRDMITLIENRINAIKDIDIINIQIVWPYELERPITASVIIRPSATSDIAQNRTKLEDIQNIIKEFFREIRDENIVIVDQNGFILNDFD